MNIEQVIAELKSARDRGDKDRVAQLTLLLVSLFSSGRFSTRLRDSISAVFDRVERQLGDSTPTDNARQLNSIAGILIDQYPDVLDRILEEVSELEIDNISSDRDELSAFLGAPVDQEGNIVPLAGSAPNADEDMELEEMLLLISPLIFVQGTRFPRRLRDVVTVDAGRVLGRNRTGLRAPEDTLRRIIRSRELGALGATLDDDSSDILKRTEKDISDAVARRVGADAENIAGGVREELLESEGIIGWVLHSRFLPTTDPQHAANDGTTFMKDDSGDLPYSESFEFVPPYGHPNCVCYQTFIYGEGVGGDETLGLSQHPGVSPRSLPDFDAWFTVQRPTVQQKFIGEPRWLASASFGRGVVSWSDVTRDGKLMGARELAGEGLQTRGERIRANREEFERRRRRYEDGLGATLTPAEERSYRRALVKAVN